MRHSKLRQYLTSTKHTLVGAADGAEDGKPVGWADGSVLGV